MPENNHEVIIDDYVFPDTVTITLTNDNSIGSRDYVSKDLYESVSSANDHWQAENAMLRELCKSMRCALADFDDKVYLTALDKTLIDAGFDLQKLGIEVNNG